MPSQIAAESLPKVELLEGFTPDEIQQLLGACSDVRFQAGDVILQSGDEHRALFILVEGTVEVELAAPFTEETMVAELQPGSVFGETSFFHPAPHSATVRCETAVTVVRLDRSDYEGMLQTKCPIAYHLGTNAAHILAARLQQTDRWIAELLQERQNAHIHKGWHRFREQMGHTFSTPKGFFGPGGSFGETN